MRYLEKLVCLANKLDNNGFVEEATFIDSLFIKVSMPLIHNDPKNPIIVYRVQDENGDGPFKTELNKWQTDPEFSDTYKPHPKEIDIDEQQPGPYYLGQDFSNEEIEKLLDKQELLLFGFESPYDAVLWFGDVTLKSLYERGFGLYQMYSTKVYLSHTKRQVMFIKDETRPEKKMPLDQVLGSRGAELQKSYLKPRTYDDELFKKLDELKPSFYSLSAEFKQDKQNKHIQGKLRLLCEKIHNFAKYLEEPPEWTEDVWNMLDTLEDLRLSFIDS